MAPSNLSSEIQVLEQELLAFETRYGIRSETFYATYSSGEEPDDDSRVLDFTEWASVYRTWLARQAEANEATEELLQIPGFLEAYERADDEARTGRLTPAEELRRRES